MEDPRTLRTIEMAVALMSSANPLYSTRDLASVTAEILGSADGIDHTFGICNCGSADYEEDGGGGGPGLKKPGSVH